MSHRTIQHTVKPALSDHSKRRPKLGFQDRLSLNAGQKYCRMLQRDHSAILSTFIKLPFVIKIVFCLVLIGRLRQVLLYVCPSAEGNQIHGALNWVTCTNWAEPFDPVFDFLNWCVAIVSARHA